MILRFSQYFLSAAAAACFVLCSLTSTAYATLDEYDFEDGEINIEYRHRQLVDGSVFASKDLGPFNGQTTTYKESATFTVQSSETFYDDFLFYNDVESIVDRDYTINLTFFGLWNEVVHTTTQTYNARIYFPDDGDDSGTDETVTYNYGLDGSAIDSFEVWLYDANGEYVLFEDAECSISSDGSGSYNLFVDLPTVPIDVYKIWVRLHYDNSAYSGYSPAAYDRVEKWFGFSDFYVNWNFQTPADGGMSDLLGMFGQLLEAIIQLPANIWGLIEEGLVGLFVPGEEEIAAFKTKWDELLASHLGALYEVGDVIASFVEVYQYQPSQSTFWVPPLTLQFGDSDWTFGDWDVQIVPDGFERFYDYIKMFTAFLATCLFVNAMKSRFEKLIGGDSNA